MWSRGVETLLDYDEFRLSDFVLDYDGFPKWMSGLSPDSHPGDMDVDQLLASPLRPDLTPCDEAAVEDAVWGCASQTDPVDDHDVTQQSEACYSGTLPPDDKSSEDQALAYVRNLFRVDPAMTAVHKAWFPEPMQWAVIDSSGQCSSW